MRHGLPAHAGYASVEPELMSAERRSSPRAAAHQGVETSWRCIDVRPSCSEAFRGDARDGRPDGCAFRRATTCVAFRSRGILRRTRLYTVGAQCTRWCPSIRKCGLNRPPVVIQPASARASCRISGITSRPSEGWGRRWSPPQRCVSRPPG